MIQFYNAVRNYLEMGMHDEPYHEYEALAIKLIDDALQPYPTDADDNVFKEAVDMIVEIAGVNALMGFYESIRRLNPHIDIVIDAAKAHLESDIHDWYIANAHGH